MPAETFGSYHTDDVKFLLKDLSGIALEGSSLERETQIQGGRHYSESLPKEEIPSQEYMDLFWELLDSQKTEMAALTGIVAEQIYQGKGKDAVLVSLARAGTPVGALIKRYIDEKYAVNLPHYSISIIRGRGLDKNAIRYILKQHEGKKIQFIDGWTGKGAISLELQNSCREIHQDFGIQLDSNIAVLADPGHCSSLFGTRDDFLLPSACLNSTVSGLISRTVLNENFISENDFHGAKYYQEFSGIDVSNQFIDSISAEFPFIFARAEQESLIQKQTKATADFKGMETVLQIGREFRVENPHLIKPGVGETTRVLLRRVPWKILVRELDHPSIRHILLLAKEKNVDIIHYPEMDYACCGLIKQLKE